MRPDASTAMRLRCPVPKKAGAVATPLCPNVRSTSPGDADASPAHRTVKRAQAKTAALTARDPVARPMVRGIKHEHLRNDALRVGGESRGYAGRAGCSSSRAKALTFA